MGSIGHAGERQATFQLVNGVTFPGGYPVRGAANLHLRHTDGTDSVFSGDLVGDDVPGFSSNSASSYHVVTSGGTDSKTIIDGLTISGGNANGEGHPVYAYTAECMHNNGGSPTLSDCTFVENTAWYTGCAMGNDDGSVTFTQITDSNCGRAYR